MKAAPGSAGLLQRAQTRAEEARQAARWIFQADWAAMSSGASLRVFAAPDHDDSEELVLAFAAPDSESVFASTLDATNPNCLPVRPVRAALHVTKSSSPCLEPRDT